MIDYVTFLMFGRAHVQAGLRELKIKKNINLMSGKTKADVQQDYIISRMTRRETEHHAQQRPDQEEPRDAHLYTNANADHDKHPGKDNQDQEGAAGVKADHKRETH